MVGEKIIFVLDAKNFSRSRQSVDTEAHSQVMRYMLTLDCRTSCFILPYLAKEPVEDPGIYKIYYIKITPEQDKVPENFQTLEKIFDIISDSVMQLKS